jgi:hypothetical protein
MDRQEGFSAYGRFVVRVSRNRIIKSPCELSELKHWNIFQDKYTSMPVPKVFRTYHVRGSLYIEMELIRGTDLQEAWLGGYLSTQVKEDIMRQLAGFVEQLSNGSPRPPTSEAPFFPF